MDKKISVIVPIYNVEKYIDQCIGSICGQSYKNLEIILVNDGAKDKSGSICDAWAKKDTRIKVLHLPNGGQSKARNAGLKLAAGELIGFVDGDDKITPNMYEYLMTMMEKEDADIAECNFTGRKSVELDCMEEGKTAALSGRDALVQQLSMKSNRRFPSTSVWSKLFRKEILEGIYFPEGRVHEEYAFLCEAFCRCERYIYVNDRLYERTLRNDSTTAAAFSIRAFDKLAVYDDREAFLEKKEDRELLKMAEAQRYDLMLHYYNQSQFHHMNEQAKELQTRLRKERRKVIESPLPVKRKLLLILLIYFESGYQSIYNKKGTKERLKNIVFDAAYMLHQSGIIKNKLKVLSIDETINALVNTDYSIVRYGDAEIAMIQGKSIEFQEYDEILSKRLYEILQFKNEKLLVGIPDIFEKLDYYTEKSRKFWKEHLFFSRKTYEKNCCTDKYYYNAFLSRLYYIYEDKEQCGKWFAQIKEIWKDKNIVVVEGAVSHNGVGNDLFDNTQKIERIICPSANAFHVYDKILQACLHYDKKDLFLVSIGNAAKVLAADLVEQGYRVIDIGNLDMEYDWFLQGTIVKKHLEKHDYISPEQNKSAGLISYMEEIKDRIDL